jgi:hypothetical protein
VAAQLSGLPGRSPPTPCSSCRPALASTTPDRPRAVVRRVRGDLRPAFHDHCTGTLGQAVPYGVGLYIMAGYWLRPLPRRQPGRDRRPVPDRHLCRHSPGDVPMRAVAELVGAAGMLSWRGYRAGADSNVSGRWPESAARIFWRPESSRARAPSRVGLGLFQRTVYRSTTRSASCAVAGAKMACDPI